MLIKLLVFVWGCFCLTGKQTVSPNCTSIKIFYIHRSGERPETRLISWGEALPELGAERKALDFLAMVLY